MSHIQISSAQLSGASARHTDRVETINPLTECLLTTGATDSARSVTCYPFTEWPNRLAVSRASRGIERNRVCCAFIWRRLLLHDVTVVTVGVAVGDGGLGRRLQCRVSVTVQRDDGLGSAVVPVPVPVPCAMCQCHATCHVPVKALIIWVKSQRIRVLNHVL